MKRTDSPLHWNDRLNQHIVFNPSRWPNCELLSRATAILVICGFGTLRTAQFHRFPQFFSDAEQYYSALRTAQGTHLFSQGDIALIWGIKLSVWIIEMGIYTGYVAAYLTRTRPVSVAKGAMEVAFPVLVAGLPVLMAFMPYRLTHWLPLSSHWHLSIYLVIMGLITLGGLINLIGLLTMRRAFTIMSEARTLITTGLFGYVRHPLYSGHIIMFFGSMLLRLHWVTILLYLLFLAGQIKRAHIEERKLEQAFPEYRAYKNRTAMFVPRIGSLKKGRSGHG